MNITCTATVTAADPRTRIIAGRIVTFGEVGRTSAGPTRFEPGSIEFGDDVRLVREHDLTTPVGRALELHVSDDGIEGSFAVARTRAGDDALAEAAEKLRDGFSVGVDVIDSIIENGVLAVLKSKLTHVGLVTAPAIKSARVETVAASENEPEAAVEEPEAPATTEVEEPIEEETVDQSTPAVVEAAAATVGVTTTPRVAPFRDAADRILTIVAAARGDQDAALRLTAAEDTLHQGTTDNADIVRTPLVGNIIDTMNADRPIIASARSLPMPSSGKSFERPMITTHTAVGAQAAEFDVLTSQKLVLDPITITKATFGGQLSISFQNRDWSDPAILNIVVQDLNKVYARGTEAAAATELAENATGTGTLAADADADVVIKALYDAAADVYAASGMMPNVVYASVDQWSRLGSLVDSAKRPLFPTLAPSNAGGVMDASSFAGNPLGLRLVVSSDLEDGSLIVGQSQFLEVYENGPAQLNVTDISTLAYNVAVYGYFASKVIVGDAFVVLAPAA